MSATSLKKNAVSSIQLKVPMGAATNVTSKITVIVADDALVHSDIAS